MNLFCESYAYNEFDIFRWIEGKNSKHFDPDMGQSS